jgi:hypothetical protein
VNSVFWSEQLLIAMVLNALVQSVQIGAYAARLAGVVSGRIATSISLFNLFVTVTRLASLFLTPMLGVLTDRAARAELADPTISDLVTRTVTAQVRMIVGAGTVGTACGAVLLPICLLLFLRGIRSFERYGSLPRSLMRLFDPRVIGAILREVRWPNLAALRRLTLDGIPPQLLFGNVLVTAIYSIGVVAAFVASVIDVNHRATAIGLSGLINGVATISFTLIVDPTSALLTDQAVRGERPVEQVKAMVAYLALTAVLGTIVGQLLLVPAARIIAFAAALANGSH